MAVLRQERLHHGKASVLDRLHASLRYGWATLPLIAAYVFVVWSTFMWFEPHPVSSYYRFAATSTVYPGQAVDILADVTRSKDGCPSIVTRTWVEDGGRVLQKTSFVGDPQPAGHEPYRRPALVPVNAKPGTLWLHTVVNFRCNLVQEVLGGVDFVLTDLKFTVVAGSVMNGYKPSKAISLAE